MAGTYDYPDVPKDVYRRHANCRCRVEYDPGSGKRQNVWSKQWTDASESGNIEARKQIGLMSQSKRQYGPDIQIGRSVGSKAKNYDILDLETGIHYNFAEGTKIQNVEVFSGKGTKIEYRQAERYANKYGGSPEDWQHVKGHGIIAAMDGDRPAEVHWSQCKGIGKLEFFIKRWED